MAASAPAACRSASRSVRTTPSAWCATTTCGSRESEGARIGRITTASDVTEYENGLTANGRPTGIATGPDGNVWVTESRAHKIARITPAGVVTEFSDGIGAGAEPVSIAAGLDDTLWFADSGRSSIGRITL